MKTLPVIESCDNCGACCMHMVMPPFVAYFDGEDGQGLLYDEEWDTFKQEAPHLVAEIRAEYDRKQREHDWPDEAPCFWFDQVSRRCKHYDNRPNICREFDVGSSYCLDFRKAAGL